LKLRPRTIALTGVALTAVVGGAGAIGARGDAADATPITFQPVGTYATGLGAGSGETAAYDRKRLFVTNSANNSLDIVDAVDAAHPALLKRIDLSPWGAGPNSVDVTDGLVAVAVEANPKTSPGAKAYFDAHVKSQKKEPDRWASGACWASMELLTSAVGKVGLDRKAIRDYVANTEHSTILGKIRFNGSENVGTPGTVSQWQKGEFEVVWPKSNATAPLMAKPAWA
jgi:hypothetical protein